MASDTHQAWKWIKENQDQYDLPILGPPMVECSVKDLKYVNQLESLLGITLLTTFTAQTRNDFSKLDRILREEKGLHAINISTRTTGLDRFSPPVNQDTLQRYGLDGWAIDFITGPERLLAMLCEQKGLHRTGISHHDTTAEQYEELQHSPISSWVTKSSLYRITRRREYGPEAVSATVVPIRPAKVWTDQPVDLSIKREIQEKINGWQAENDDILKKVEASNQETSRAREKIATLDLELVSLKSITSKQTKLTPLVERKEGREGTKAERGN